MLQISSGRFFDDGKVNEAELDAILYSNHSWVAPIKTSAGELRPVETSESRAASYALRYTIRYQPAPNDILVRPHGDEAVEQFRLLASFYFQAFFHVDRAYVESVCRSVPSNTFDTTIPKMFVPNFFDLGKRGTQPEAVGFVPFIDKVLSMPRKQYRLLMSCLAGFFEALEVLGNNFDLAYSIMVYTLEALSKSVEQPAAAWEDYDQNVRGKLETQFAAIDPKAAETIRLVLLENPHLKLKKRFVRFIASHINDTYFTTEAEGLRFALAKSDLERSLGNLYDARSGYVHELRQVQEQLRIHWMGADTDVLHWKNEPLLSFAGLVRLSCHVIRCFVERQPRLEREDCSWRQQIPGLLSVPLAPECWVGRTEQFHPSHSRQHFSGFIEHLVANYSKPQVPVLDLRLLMVRVEEMAPTAKRGDRIAMLALYWLFNGMIRKEDRRPGWDTFLDRWTSEVTQCTIELLAVRVIGGAQLPWPADTCATAFEQYQRSRYKATAIHLPRLLEVAIMVEIGNRFLDQGETDEYELWFERAFLDSAGNKASQEYVRACAKSRERGDSQRVLRRGTANNKGDESFGTRSGSSVEAEIRLFAYLKWVDGGKPECDGISFWLQAEKELLAKRS